MNTKNIEAVIAPREPHFVGDGFRVHNFIPSGYHLDMRKMDPFIMLDYNSKFHFPATDKPKGVGVHPHRGFETGCTMDDSSFWCFTQRISCRRIL